MFIKPYHLLLSALLVSIIQGEQCDDRPYLAPGYVNRSDEYPFSEAALQIFTNIRIPCDGVVTEWTFKPLMNYILQLHLGVFRQRSEKVFQQVGESYIDVYRLTNAPRSPEGWVSVLAEPPVSVMQGDVIGMYYDNLTTVQPMLAIPSKKLFGKSRDLNAPTYILLWDTPAVRYKNYLIDVSAASIEYRVPALAAIVRSPYSQPLDVVTPEPPLPPQPTSRKTTPTTRRTTTTPPQQELTLEPPYDYYEPPTTRFIPPPIPRTTPPTNLLDARCYASPTSALFCTQRQIRAFYDYNSGICREYFGCPAATNEGNNFASSAECRLVCTSQQQPTEDVCKRTPTALEVCYEKSTRYFYNPYKQACMTFFGCSLGGLKGNNFDTLEQCNQCKGQVLLTPIAGAGARAPVPVSSYYQAPAYYPASNNNAAPIILQPVQNQGVPAGLVMQP